MKNEDIKTYIAAVINDTDIGEIEKEISIAKLLFLVYIAGLERKDFPIDLLWHDIDLEKEIGAQWHTFVAQLAILKSSRSIGFYGMEFIRKNCQEIANHLRDYFLPLFQ